MAGVRSNYSTEALKGSVKEALGKLTGDARIEADGRRQKLAAPLPGRRPRVGQG